MNVKIKCATCGSENVKRNCDAYWNVENQKWEVCATFDHFDCDDCGGECSVIEEEIKTMSKTTRYAETFWTIGDLEKALKDYYGEDYKATDEELSDIMERIQDQLLDDVVSHGNEHMLSMSIRIIEKDK